MFSDQLLNDFNPSIDVAGCFCVCSDKILFLKRSFHKPYGNTWGVPGGKIEANESPKEACIREAYEEVGINIDNKSLQQFGKIYCRLSEMDYLFHMFKIEFELFPNLILNEEEHIEARWVTYQEALELPLIIGGAEALNYFKTYKDKCNA